MVKANIQKQQKELRSKQIVQSEGKVKKTKKAVKPVQKEKMSTMSIDSNNNVIVTNDVSNLEKPFDEKKLLLDHYQEDTPKNSHFNLRKRKKINYSVTRPDFVYESLSDSDYEETKSKKIKRKKNENKSIRNESIIKKNMNPTQCRDFQIKSLLNWKNYPVESPIEEKEYLYYEVDDILNTNFNKICQDLQCILINPPWSSKNPKFDFAKFRKLKLPLKCMKEGLIFIWVERDLMSEVIEYFEEKGIRYVENMIWVKLNSKNQSNLISQNPSNLFDITDLYFDENYEYFSKSKMTLLIFRKFKPNNERTLELRHQRTGDAVFDFVDNNIPFYRPFNYVYRLIEILLPKANYSQKNECMKLLEIWASKNSKRKGWIHIVQK